MSLETGMLLLHKHGHDCMLVSTPCPFYQEYSKLTCAWRLSMKGGKSRPGRNGLSGRICALRGNVTVCSINETRVKWQVMCAWPGGVHDAVKHTTNSSGLIDLFANQL